MILKGPKTGLVHCIFRMGGKIQRSNLPEGYSTRKCPKREPEGLWL